MLPYWLLFTLCAAGALQYRPVSGRPIQGGPLLAALAIAVTVLIGLRYEVGGDWDTYIRIFDNISYLNPWEAIATGDPGYALLNWIMYRIGAGVWGVNLACAAIFVWGLNKFARQQPNPWLAVLVAVPYLIIVVAMGYTRQAVAIGLILAGLSTIEGRSILKFSLYMAAAVTFHKTAVLVLPLVALAVVRQHFFGAVLFAVLFAVLYYTFLDAAAERLMTNYVDAQYESEGAAIRVSMNLLPAAIYLLASRRFALDEVQHKIWRNFSLGAFASLLMLGLVSSTTAVDRLALYLIPLQLFVFARVPNAFASSGRSDAQNVILIIIYAAIVQFVWLNYASHAEYWLPYRFYPFEEGV